MRGINFYHASHTQNCVPLLPLHLEFGEGGREFFSLFVFLGTGEGTVCAFMCLYFPLRREGSAGRIFTQTHVAVAMCPSPAAVVADS